MNEVSNGICPATQDDLEDVISLWESSGLTRPWNDAGNDFRSAVAGTTSDILMLRRAGDTVATITVGFDGHRGWVYYLGVAPDHRCKGLGRKMMDAAEAWLKRRDAPKIQLMVRDDNEAAIGFYKALGYEVQPVVTIGRRLDQD